MRVCPFLNGQNAKQIHSLAGMDLGSTSFSFIRTVTVGSGIAPDLLTLHCTAMEALAGSGIPHTAGGELHPALRTNADKSALDT